MIEDYDRMNRRAQIAAVVLVLSIIAVILISFAMLAP